MNDILYSETNFEKFRKKISYVPQELSLVNFFQPMIILILLIALQLKKEKIEFYLKKFGIYSNISSMKYKLDNKLGDKGILLSGGQKQRIILAAALSREPEILILDEATNALDSKAEKEILDILIEEKNLTLILISHQTNLIEKFDKVYKFKNFKIIL